MRKSAIVAAILIAACTDRSPVAPDRDEPTASISDAAHESGNTHFHFLPPIVPAPSPRGAFDASLSPVVEICEWTGAACVAPLVAAFTMTSGPGAETIRLAAADELYVVNWLTDRFAVDPGKVYRVRVLVAGTELGHADVAVVGSAGQVKNIDTGLFFPLADGRTLPIKFRIERGAVFVVGPAGGTVVAADGQVALEVPPGATGDLGITVTPSAPPPGTVGVVPGTVFDFGPEGTTFAEPVRLRIAYDEASLPPGLSEDNLTLLTEHDGLWQELPGEVVDAAANVVSAFVSGFSKKGVGGKVGSVEIDPTDATLSVCATQQFTATVRSPDGTPLTGRQVVWSSSDNAVAVVDRNGVARGSAAGTAMIIAASGGEGDSATMTVVANPGVTSCTNIVEIDARGLSAPQFSVSGKGTFSSSTVTALSLPAGDYAISAGDGRVLVTVAATGTVDYATSLDGVLAGRGTIRITLLGAAITIDGRALSVPWMDLASVPRLGTSTPAVVHLLPTPGGAQRLSAGDGGVAFEVLANGTVAYDPALDLVLQGRGTSTLVVSGVALTIDARALSVPWMDLASVPRRETATPVSVHLLPTPGGAQRLSSGDGGVAFEVLASGTVAYDPALDLVLQGRGTSTLVVRGVALMIDARALSVPWMDLASVPRLETATPVSVHLLPTPGGAQRLFSGDGQVAFDVLANGTVTYDPALDLALRGRGTSTLVVQGLQLTIDATALSVPWMDLASVPRLETGTPATLHLLPTPGGAQRLFSGDGQVAFEVLANGTVAYDPALDLVLQGRGASTLVVQGVALTIDATALSVPWMDLASVPRLQTTTLASVRLLPTSGGAQRLSSGDGQVAFEVLASGTVDYHPALDLVLQGRGTNTLVVHGVALTIDGTPLSAPQANVAEAPSFSTATPATLRLLPNVDALHPTRLLAAAGQVAFLVTSAGTVDYDPALEGILAGRGTARLTAAGAAITIDATTLATSAFSIGGVGTFSTSAPQSLRLLPNVDALHTYGFSSTVFSFAFLVTTRGTVDYDSSLDSRLSGRGTALLEVVSTTGGPPAYSWTPLATHSTRSLREIWGASASEVFAAADLFDVLRFDGSIWIHIVGPTADSLSFGGLSGRAANDWYVVGSRRTAAPPPCGGPAGRTTSAFVLRYDGTKAIDAAFPFVCNSAHRGAWVGPQSVVAVGNSPFDPTLDLGEQIGRVWRLRDDAWSPEFSLNRTHELSAFLHAWGSGEQDVYAVGGRNLFGSAQTPLGVIAHYDGVAWSVVADEIEHPLNVVWGTSPSNVFAVGQNGIILHFNGAAWTRQESGVTVNLNGLWGSSANNVLAVGAGGTILQYDGHTWTRLESGTTTGLTAVWMTESGDKTFVVGQGGLSLLGTVQP
jgi:nicotinamidase-related amidase